MDDQIRIKCEGFSVDHSTENMETTVMVLSPSRKPKNGMRGKFHLSAGHSTIEIDGVARVVKGALILEGIVGDCMLAVVGDE